MNSVISSVSYGSVVAIIAISTAGSPTLGGLWAINVNQAANDAGHIIKEEYSTSHDSVEINKEHKVINEIASYLKLGFDWDGYEGKAPKRSTVINAIDFANHLISEDFFHPKATLSASGAVGLYWEMQDFFAEIDFDDEGYVAFFAESSINNKKIYSDDFLIKNDEFKDDDNLKPLLSFLQENFKNISTCNDADSSGLVSTAFAKSAFSQRDSSFYSL